MSQATRRKIAQLRALAASTTFPEEAKSARAKADKLEQELGPQPPPFRSDNLRTATFGSDIFEEAVRAMMARMDAHAMDAMIYGTGIFANGQRVDPMDFFTQPPAKEGKTNG